MKRLKRKIPFDREVIRTLASVELAAAHGGLPAVTEGDVECPTTIGQLTCDGNTCVSRCASDCYTCGRTCREDCL